MASKEHLAAKQVVIDEISAKLANAKAAVVVDYMGLTVAENTEMRKKLREAGVDFVVYKNTLMNRAIQGTVFESLKDTLSGPSAFAFSTDDVTAPARVIAGAMKDYNKMSFKGAVVEGTFYDEAGVKALSEIPSRDELIAKFMGSIQSPVSKAVRTFKAIADAKEA